jgi:hypothetical protein
MKRISLVLSIVMVLAFASMAAAEECCIYGCGIVKGTVKLCGSFIGQEGATVKLTGMSKSYFGATETITDPDGFYKFKGTLPVCYVHTGNVKGEFVWAKCCGAPDELWKGQNSWRFRKMNQNERIVLKKNIKLRYFSQLP